MTTHRNGARARAAAAAGLIGASALLLSACGSSGSTNASGTQASPSSSARGAAMQAYRTCLSQHGVNLPTGRPSGRPSGGYGGGNGGGYGGGGGFGFGGASANPTMQAAMQACASLRPKGGFGGGRGGFNSTAMAAFTSCLKDHGVTLPTTGGLRALNTTDPKTAAAYNTCKPLLPTRSPGAAAPSPSAS
ncbi:hypothetical protein [Streptacidiphilus jiangxiensis]|uniref:Uncharacterized protein n=1 Tax=Streptacidiphilus jiangxiensis TaxID=235985 RepID=A0A1H7J6E3_STRJI|nr:hypothetical protein [Streptacidiphilus jiangxiensis]SEK70248.1 hypothetical protein SAMN05414137_103165 [Streptacidiphilus jiangxiensis]